MCDKLLRTISAWFGKSSRSLFEYDLFTVRSTFELFMIYFSIGMFLAFVVAIGLFERNRYPLEAVRARVEVSTTTMDNLKKAILTIKEVKCKSLTIEDYKKMRRNRESRLRLLGLYRVARRRKPAKKSTKSTKSKLSLGRSAILKKKECGILRRKVIFKQPGLARVNDMRNLFIVKSTNMMGRVTSRDHSVK